MSNKAVNYTTIDGKVISGERMAKILDGKPSRPASKRSDAPQTYHKGWRVVGHPPGSLDRAKADADEAFDEYSRMTPQQIKGKFPGGKGIPRPWDEPSWRRNAPVKSVRSKPYEVHSAAVECMRMAEREGWTDLRIDTLSKGEPPQQAGLL